MVWKKVKSSTLEQVKYKTKKAYSKKFKPIFSNSKKRIEKEPKIQNIYK